MSYDCVEFGEAIRHARKAKSMTAGDLGRMLSPPVSHTAVCKWETGKTEPGITHLVQVSEILDLDLPSIISPNVKKRQSEIDTYLERMTDNQRSAVLGVARAMVDC